MVKYPDDWKKIPFGESFEVYRNNTCSRALMTEVSGIVQNIHYGDVLVKYGAILDCQNDKMPYLTEEGTRVAAQDYVQDGDVIIADTAEDETCGKVVEIVNVGGRKVVAGLHTVFCRPKIGYFTPGWLGYWMNSRAYHDQLHSLMTGIKVLSVSKSSLSKTYILAPKKDEQKRIATVLGNVDKLIDNLLRRIEKKLLVKQGVMQDLLTGKKRLPGFAGEWEEKRLGNCANVFCDGDWIESADQSDRGIRLVQTGNIGEGVFLDKADKKRYVSEETFKRLNCCEIFAGDVLVSRLPDPAGRACLLPLATERRITAVDCTVIRFNDQMAAEYFVQYSQTVGYYRQISEQMAGSTRQRISRNSLGNVVVLCPPTLAEQKAIAKVLGDMDAEIAKLEAKHEKYRQLKQGLMNDLLTGKVRI